MHTKLLHEAISVDETFCFNLNTKEEKGKRETHGECVGECVFAGKSEK